MPYITLAKTGAQFRKEFEIDTVSWRGVLVSVESLPVV